MMPILYRGYTAEANEVHVEEIPLMKKQGANLIRWMLHKTYWTTDDSNVAEYMQWFNNEMLPKLDAVLAAARSSGMKVVIDLHDLPGGRDVDGSQRVFYNAALNDTYVKVWTTLATRYKGHSALYGYGLMNEPVMAKDSPVAYDHMATQYRAAKAIRNIDPVTPVIFASKVWNNPTPFFTETTSIKNVIYELHMYLPHLYTHQGLPGVVSTTHYKYPGTIGGVPTTKATLTGYLQVARQFQLNNNVKIFVGEFSAIRWAAGAATWLQDCIDIFHEYGWDWTYHCWDLGKRGAGIWSLEIENGASGDVPVIAALPNERKKAIMKGFMPYL